MACMSISEHVVTLLAQWLTLNLQLQINNVPKSPFRMVSMSGLCPPPQPIRPCNNSYLF
jgi:hypothetical protein